MSCHLPAVRPHVIHIAWTLNLISLLSLYLDYISIFHVTYLLYDHMLSTLQEPSICYPYCPCIWITSVYVMSLTCCTATCYPHYMNLKSDIPTISVSGVRQYMWFHLPDVSHMVTLFTQICHVTYLLYGHVVQPWHWGHAGNVVIVSVSGTWTVATGEYLVTR